MKNKLSDFRNKCLKIISNTKFKENILEVKESLLVDKKGKEKNEYSIYLSEDVFTADIIKKTDCFLAMYHDQGLAAFKALTFGKGVNVTLGLPIIRTSVDHGTGLDIVGSNKIDPSSFFESVQLAIKLANNQH